MEKKVYLTIAGYEQEIELDKLADMIERLVRNNFSFSVRFA